MTRFAKAGALSSLGARLEMANPIDKPNQGFESDFNGGWLLGPEGNIQSIKINCKLAIAHQLLNALKIVLLSKSRNL